MKKIMMFLFILLLSLALISCSNNPPAGPSEESPEVKQPVETTEQPPVIEETKEAEAETLEPESPEPVAETTESDEDDEDGGFTGQKEWSPFNQPKAQSANILVTIDQIRYELFPDEQPDLEGITWGQALFENNSQYPIRTLSITTDVDSIYGNEIGTYNSVLPGEISAVMAGVMEPDMKLKQIKYVVLDRGTNYEITYDVEKDTHSQIEDPYLDMFRVKKKDVLLPVDFEFCYVTDPPDPDA